MEVATREIDEVKAAYHQDYTKVAEYIDLLNCVEEVARTFAEARCRHIMGLLSPLVLTIKAGQRSSVLSQLVADFATTPSAEVARLLQRPRSGHLASTTPLGF